MVGHLVGPSRPGASMISDREERGEPTHAFTRAFSSGMLAGAPSGPTVPRIALGTQLRRLREASNITTAQAAEAIRATHSKISRLERGRSEEHTSQLQSR